ncbi:MAG: polyprenyl synthetase family protein [Gammaproteobacteria bacterium]
MLDTFISDIKTQVIADTKAYIIPDSKVAQAMLYTAAADSKCFRAALVHATSIGLGFEVEQKTRELAVCIEMLHSYSLIHDDLPCMDNDDVRRGKPANHIAYGESTAVLAGDALQLRALQIIVESQAIEEKAKIKILNNLIISCGYQGMILGQELDIRAENDKTLNIELIHGLKTGKLIQSAIVCASMLHKSKVELETLNKLGWHIGMAFQITDDILEHTETSLSLGKSNLSDTKNQKLTYVSKFGINLSSNHAQQHINSAIKLAQTSFSYPDLMMGLAKMILERTS